MNRTTVFVIMTLFVLVFLAGPGHAVSMAGTPAGDSAAPGLQQAEALNIQVWLSETGSTQPVRRLGPGTSEAQIVVQSDLRANDPKNFVVRLIDANSVPVFQSDTLALPSGSNTESIVVSGKMVLQGYVSYTRSEKAKLETEVNNAVTEAGKGSPNLSDLRGYVESARSAVPRLDPGIEGLLAFSVSAEASNALGQARTHLEQASQALDTVADLLEADEIDWAAVRAGLGDVQAAVNNAATQIDAGLGAVDQNADRSFPVTGVSGRCNQNSVQLRVADSGTLSDDFWWTVGTPGAPARLANPEEPATVGSLLAQSARIYSTQVDVAGARHDTNVHALALDALCLPVPGVTVNFSTPAGSIVTVENAQVTTDANGVASVKVNATDQVGDGSATVNASVDSATATTGITVIGPPKHLNLLLGGSEFTRVPNYGVESTVRVSAVVKDVNANDVADGTPVQFSIDPARHSFTDNGPVTTSKGQASVGLVFGLATGFFTVEAQSGDAIDSQPIRVVGNPDQIEVRARPSTILVTTPIVDRRSSELRVTVRDSEGQPAPDSTIVEFEFVNDEDADWAYFTLRPDSLGYYTTPIIDGTASTNLVGSFTNLADPSQTLAYRQVRVRVTATYSPDGDTRAPVSGETTVTLRGYTVLLPIVSRQ